MSHTFDRLKAALADRYAIERELGAHRMTMHCFARPLQVMLASTLLAALFPVSLRAQCADGTPPPCDVAVRRPAVAARPEPPSADVRARSFLVLPFRNVRAITEDDWLAAAPVMLGEALSRWQEVSVVSDERLRLALRRHGLAPEEAMDEEQIRRVAEETGGWTVVTGEVLRLGNRIRVTGRALDVATNRVVVRISEQAESEEEIPELYERIAAELLKTVGIDASEVDLSAVTTASLDALKAYVRGVRHFNRAEMLRAREAFEEAVRLDSTFALPYLKLAEGWLFISWEALYDGTHPAYGYLSRAVALSDRLPPREQRLVHAMDALFHAQFAAAREQLEGLLALDSADVDALIALAWLESVDGVLVPVDGKMRIRGSFNRSNSLAKTAVLLDPSRSVAYQILVKSYVTAGGWFMGAVATAQRESASLPAYFLSTGGRIPLILVLRDTLELIPLALGGFAGAYKEERARARAVARTWVERWLAASPSVAEAHMWAARVFELDESYDKALSELATADSLGVETELENLTARRMVLLAKSGQRAEALQLADSLRAAGIFVTDRIVNPFFWEYGGATFSLYLVNGDWAKASEFLEQMGAALRAVAPIPEEAMVEVMVFFLCELTSPKPLRADVVKSIVNSINEYPATASMQNCATSLLEAAAAEIDAAERTELASEVLDGVDSLLAHTERYGLANALAAGAVGADSTEATLLRALATFKRITELDPENMGALYQVGRTALFAETDLDLAVRSFLRYVEHERQTGAPSHASAHWRLGMVYELQGKIEEARAEYEAALKLNPNSIVREALAKLPPKQ